MFPRSFLLWQHESLIVPLFYYLLQLFLNSPSDIIQPLTPSLHAASALLPATRCHPVEHGALHT